MDHGRNVGGAGLSGAAALVDAAGGEHGAAPRRPGRDDREHRAVVRAARARHVRREPAVGNHRLRAGLRRSAADRRTGQRRARAPERVPRRPAGLRRRVRARRGRNQRRTALRGAGPPGRLRRAARAGRPLAADDHLHRPARTGPRLRRVRRRRRRRLGARPGRGRAADGVRELAVVPVHQRAAGPARRGRHGPRAGPGPGPRRGTARRRGRTAQRGRVRRPRLRLQRGRAARVGVGQGARAAGRRGADVGGVRGRRGARPAPAAAAARARAPGPRRRVRRDHPDVRRDVPLLPVHELLHADGAWVLPGRGRPHADHQRGGGAGRLHVHRRQAARPRAARRADRAGAARRGGRACSC